MSLNQTRTPYLVIGNGRLAHHLKHWFALKQIPIRQWNRKSSKGSSQLDDQKIHEETLAHLLEQSDIVMLAVSDAGIAPLFAQLQSLMSPGAFPGAKKVIHFSGAMSHPSVACFHPLASFSHSLFEESFYDRIGFVSDGKYEFSDIFVGFPNICSHLPDASRSYYHSLCVFSGNFATILWTHTLTQFRSLHIPDQTLHAYLESVVNSFVKNGTSSLTGPLVREDANTIAKHLEVMGPSEVEIYRAFLQFWELHKAKLSRDNQKEKN